MAVQHRAYNYKHLEGVDETGIGTDNHFGEFNLRGVNKVCNSMFTFSDMRKFYGSDNPQKLTPEVVNKNTFSVTKAQMAEWLFTAIHLLDLFAADVICPLFQSEMICTFTHILKISGEKT